MITKADRQAALNDLQMEKTNPHADMEMLDGRVDGLEVKLDSSIKNLKSRMDGFHQINRMLTAGILTHISSQITMLV
ncbi:MAG: hypothetical protein OXD01_02275 [Gammaproteobacteria bacterium]|nr:hypothetical protein [Gammaproteobacteria bacterium]